ncbi:MAG: thiamine pyrophosphate-dependent enzyme [Candidatus Sericytochromatia bacterium]
MTSSAQPDLSSGSPGSDATTVADVLARALVDAGLAVATNVPGHGGSQVFAALSRLMPRETPISFHEEVAFGLAHGAALTGGRAACLVKTHGLLKAANAVVDALASGTTAGLLTLVFNDPTGTHSDGILDPETVLKGLRLPYERADLGDLRGQVLASFERSEATGLPQALIVDARTIGQAAAERDRAIAPCAARYARDVARHVVCPLFAGYQAEILEARLANRDPDAIARPDVTTAALPPAMLEAMAAYAPFFEAFAGVREGALVAGDTGVSSLFALEPHRAVDVVGYMGGSVPLATGALLAGRRAWALSGDFSFIAAGRLGLEEAEQRRLPLKVAIIDNGRALATGGQAVPAGLLEQVLAGHRERVELVGPEAGPAAIAEALARAEAAEGMRIVVVTLPAR